MAVLVLSALITPRINERVIPNTLSVGCVVLSVSILMQVIPATCAGNAHPTRPKGA